MAEPSAPLVIPRWFYASNNPIEYPAAAIATNTVRATRSPTLSIKTKPSAIWTPFSEADSAALERAYESNDVSAAVSVSEDHLYDVKVAYRIMTPIYWDGPAYPVRRATWFMQVDSSKWVPCEEVLAQQVEAGYHKYKPYMAPLPNLDLNFLSLPDGNTRSKRLSFPMAKTEDAVVDTSAATVEEKKLEMTLASQPVEKQWNLLGPYLGQYVAYTGVYNAWLLSNSTSSKLAKSIITRLTNKHNLGGTRLLRGYAEVKKAIRKQKSKASSVPSSPKLPAEEDREQEFLDDKLNALSTEDLEEEERSEETREIDHLVFVIPGAGQRLLGQNFIEDVNTLRKSLKTVFNIAMDSNVYSKRKPSNGIQVLPIPWRQEVEFQISSQEAEEKAEADLGVPGGDEGQPTLDELTVDSVPNIRTAVSDVIMDIPLYLTPKYRDQIIAALCRLINKIYLRYVSRNPVFLERNGHVSIIGHSLGALIAFDMLSMQPVNRKLDAADILTLAGKSTVDIPSTLLFPVENFFQLGSPAGVMLLIKGQRVASRKTMPSSITNIPSRNSPFSYPAANNVYNIFHKSDPIAYRLEPLISRQYGTLLNPEPIPSIKELVKRAKEKTKTGNRITNKAGAMYESFKIGLTTNLVMRGLGLSRQQIYEDLQGSKDAQQPTTTTTTTMTTRHARSSSDSAVHVASAKGYFPTTSNDGYLQPPVAAPSPNNGRFSEGAKRLRMLNTRGRVDYCLQSNDLENRYWSAFSAHLQYWKDADVAAFLIKEIYKEYE